MWMPTLWDGSCLSSLYIVTHSGVERALFLWVKHMEGKGEQELFNVSNEEQLSGEGWLAPFCCAYKICEHCWHGEAGSVDLAAAVAERKRCQDRGLSTKQMSGKKKEKFLNYPCEKFNPIYIGKSQTPRCFQKQTPEHISYQPTNIQVEFFEPNMTPFMQPCDAGIICCFKALYHKNFCQRAIDLDEGGMMMAQHAWDQVSSETMKHCWDHTQIQL
ncbi:hypothetical protein BS17DRAFT_793639 [Gyrodon lividus]|nr:hypothetical protein BS17DRAFT_793639 [Gyrodon lividus]